MEGRQLVFVMISSQTLMLALTGDSNLLLLSRATPRHTYFLGRKCAQIALLDQFSN